MRRITWVDAVRGFGMLMVVYGHSFSGPLKDIFYWFHIPLFFVMSGYMFRSNEPWSEYALRRSRQLLVPYAVWLFLLSLLSALLIPGPISPVAKGALLGGERLPGVASSLWFLTCLYVAAIAYHVIRTRVEHYQHAIVLACAGIAIARSQLLAGYWFAWSLDACFAAIVFIHLGALAKSRDWENNLPLLSVASLPFILAIGYQLRTGAIPPVDFRDGRYGWPVIGWVIAASGSAMIVFIVKAGRFLQKPIGHFGRVSLVILTSHLAIIEAIRHLGWSTDSMAWLGFAVSLAIPVFLVKRIRVIGWVRTYLLGEAPEPRRR